MIKIIGLLNLKELFIFKSPEANKENAIEAAYKFSEDGANGIAVYGKTFSERKTIANLLKPKLDIPVNPIITSEKQIESLPYEKIFFSIKKIKSLNREIIFTREITEIEIFKENNIAILVTNKKALKVFNSEPDYIDEIVSLITCKAVLKNVKFFLTENVLSARKGAEICKKLF